MAVSFKPIRPLLQTGVNSFSRWVSYIGLGIGVLLLLCSGQMFVNMQQLMKEGSIRKDGFDYISITKTITNETMGQPKLNLFHEADIEELKTQDFIEGVAPLIANDFRVQLSAGNMLPFSTDMFLETLENEFIDTVPPSFTWQEGQSTLPIILSSDFFDIYNVFALGQGLPQISRETASTIPVQVSCFGNGMAVNFVGKIVAFSDRVNSVLVPKSFLDWANKNLGTGKSIEAGRVFIKTKDANDSRLVSFLDQKNYKISRDKTLLGRNKIVIQGILSGLGIFGLLVVILALLLFSFYLQLMILRSKDSLALLLTLGYSPAWLSKNVANRFIPVYIVIVLISLVAAQFLQWSFHHFVMGSRAELSPLLHWSIIVVAILLILLATFTNYRMVRRIVRRL